MKSSNKPVPKVAAAATAAGGFSIAAAVAMILGLDVTDPTVVSIAGLIATWGPVAVAYLKKDRRHGNGV